jgi:hypothetical protein
VNGKRNVAVKVKNNGWVMTNRIFAVKIYCNFVPCYIILIDDGRSFRNDEERRRRREEEEQKKQKQQHKYNNKKF